MDFGGAKAELDDGIIFMMAGGVAAHARIAGNIYAYLRIELRGSGCSPYGSDFAVRTGERTLRFPDVSIYCGDPDRPENDDKQLLGDPRIVFEVLSRSTASHDQKVKLAEYVGLSGIDAIVFVDPATERLRLVQRTGAEGWSDNWLPDGADLPLASVGLTIPRGEIFARG